MAGQEGERLMAMINDPIEAQRTQKWMNMFGLSNQGTEFNQAKMMGGMPPA
jgi:TusA-related sulfurtransferase